MGLSLVMLWLPILSICFFCGTKVTAFVVPPPPPPPQPTPLVTRIHCRLQGSRQENQKRTRQNSHPRVFTGTRALHHSDLLGKCHPAWPSLSLGYTYSHMRVRTQKRAIRLPYSESQSSEPVWPSGKAGKQKSPSSTLLRLSLLFKKVVVCGHCLVTLSLTVSQWNFKIALIAAR